MWTNSEWDNADRLLTGDFPMISGINADIPLHLCPGATGGIRRASGIAWSASGLVKPMSHSSADHLENVDQYSCWQ